MLLCHFEKIQKQRLLWIGPVASLRQQYAIQMRNFLDQFPQVYKNTNKPSGSGNNLSVSKYGKVQAKYEMIQNTIIFLLQIYCLIHSFLTCLKNPIITVHLFQNINSTVEKMNSLILFLFLVVFKQHKRPTRNSRRDEDITL